MTKIIKYKIAWLVEMLWMVIWILSGRKKIVAVYRNDILVVNGIMYPAVALYYDSDTPLIRGDKIFVPQLYKLYGSDEVSEDVQATKNLNRGRETSNAIAIIWKIAEKVE